MRDLLIDHQGKLAAKDLIDYARQLGLDVDRFTDELRTHAWRDRIAADVESADLSGGFPHGGSDRQGRGRATVSFD